MSRLGRIGGGSSGGSYVEHETPAMLERLRKIAEQERRRHDTKRQLADLDRKAGRRDTEFRAKLVPLYVDGEGGIGRARAIETGCPKFRWSGRAAVIESDDVHIANVDWGVAGGRSDEAWCGAMARSASGAPKRWGRMQMAVTCEACRDLVADAGISPRYTCM